MKTCTYCGKTGCKETDHRLTPQWVLDAVGPIWLDVCTEPDNPTDAEYFFTARSLESDWDKVMLAESTQRRRTLYMNMLFSNPKPWIDRWCGVPLRDPQNHTHLAFVPVDYSATWWQQIDSAAEWRIELKRRPKCYAPARGKNMDVARCVALFGRGRIDHRLCELGRFISLWKTPF